MIMACDQDIVLFIGNELYVNKIFAAFEYNLYAVLHKGTLVTKVSRNNCFCCSSSQEQK
jgi:hypothetical protein